MDVPDLPEICRFKTGTKPKPETEIAKPDPLLTNVSTTAVNVSCPTHTLVLSRYSAPALME
jgi:hypothetical protein